MPLSSADVRGVAVAASTAVRATLAGPVQPAVAVGAPAGAVYLRAADGELIAVLGPAAARLPIGAVAGNENLLGNRPSTCQQGQVGGGRIETSCFSAHVVRWWNPRPTLPPLAPGVLATNLAQLADHGAPAATGLPDRALRATLPALGAALRERDETAAVDAAATLVGLGPGLTPAGDDVLVGLLSALTCLGGPAFTRVAVDVQAAAAGRTTDLSLALLRHAALGHCVGAVGALLRALAGLGQLQAASRKLLAVGHSSGAALCAGVVLGADVAARL